MTNYDLLSVNTLQKFQWAMLSPFACINKYIEDPERNLLMIILGNLKKSSV